MKPDLHEMLDSFRTSAEVPDHIGGMIDRFLKLSRQDQVELLAYFTFALMDKWGAEEEADARGRKAIQDILDRRDMVQAGREPRQ
jgi:hypothetical protein